MEITLVSSEGSHYTFSSKILELSTFLAELPDPFMPVDLSRLEINFESLEIIKKTLEIANYAPLEIKDPLNHPLVVDSRKSEEFIYIESISIENLLLLALAVHKLELKSLQLLINLRIADLMRFETFEEVKDALDIDLSNNEHLDLYLKHTNNWQPKNLNLSEN